MVMPAAAGSAEKTDRHAELHKGSAIFYRDVRGVEHPGVVTKVVSLTDPRGPIVNLVAYGVEHGDEAAALERSIGFDETGVNHKWHYSELSIPPAQMAAAARPT